MAKRDDTQEVHQDKDDTQEFNSDQEGESKELTIGQGDDSRVVRQGEEDSQANDQDEHDRHNSNLDRGNPEDSDAQDPAFDSDGDISEDSHPQDEDYEAGVSDNDQEARVAQDDDSEADSSEHSEEADVAEDETKNPKGTFPLPHLIRAVRRCKEIAVVCPWRVKQASLSRFLMGESELPEFNNDILSFCNKY